jgi:hypothetical protein
MDLIYASWVPSHYDAGRTAQIPANFGTEGSLSINDWTPTYVPVNGAAGRNPHVPVTNHVDPIDWRQIVVGPEEAARFQTQLLSRATMVPANFVPPGTASLQPPGVR